MKELGFLNCFCWGKVVHRFHELKASDDPLFKQFSRAQYMGFKEK